MDLLLRAAAAAYAAATRADQATYDRGLRATRSVAGLRIVSVGGLRAGGEGKTPMALYLASRLADRGLRVAVLGRGYRSRWERGLGVVSDGRGAVETDAALGGDEATMIARRRSDLIVVVGADRVAAAERARSLGAEVAVLDSGFQHRRLARDLDLALVGWPWDLERERLLPAGPLRERPSALGRADLLAHELPEGVSPLRAPSLAFRLVPSGVVGRSSRHHGAAGSLRGARALVVAGIARPERLERSCRELGVEVVGRSWFADHHRYGAGEGRRLEQLAARQGAELIVTTEKDLGRLEGVLGLTELVALRVDLELVAGEALLERALVEAVGLDSERR